jgi:hypothetical protein
MHLVHFLFMQMGEMPILGIFEQIMEGVSAMEDEHTFRCFLITC